MTLLLIIFVTTLVFSGGAYLLTNRTLENRQAAKVRNRLAGKERPTQKTAAAQQLFERENDDDRTIFQRLLAKLNIEKSLLRLLEQAGVQWEPGQLVLVCGGAALLAFNLWWYFAPVEFRDLSFVLAPAASLLPIAFLRVKRRRRIYAFEAQFPDALQFIARAMRAGHAFSVSLEMLHKEFSEPLSSEFRRVFEEQNLGLPVETALEKLGQRMPMLDVRFFVAAVILQKRTGGNLAEILENLATLIRERFKLRGQIRTISAHGRLSSAVLTGIPIVVGFLLYMVNRQHMMFFVEEELGRLMAGLAAGFVVLGYLIMQRIVKIEV